MGGSGCGGGTGFDEPLYEGFGALGRLDGRHLLAQVQAVWGHEALLLARVDHHKLARGLHQALSVALSRIQERSFLLHIFLIYFYSFDYFIFLI